MKDVPLYTIPIDRRPPHGPLFSKIFFPLLFNLGQLGINSAQFLTLPLLLIPFWGQGLFDEAIGWTKDCYGRLLILITVLFAPTSLILTTNSPASMRNLVERDPVTGYMTKINLPDRLVVMGNHQAYLDWMYLWILACYAGHAKGIIILLKASLRRIPVVGWGMQFFRFIFLNRSWASDKSNLTLALTRLGQRARSIDENTQRDLITGTDVHTPLVATAKGRTRWPLWLLIFPEGTITSDEERAKSVRYANREGVPDFATVLHPRSTGLLFCLRTLLPEIPDLQLMDVTIGYPGVPYGKYPQEWYGLLSVFFRSIPPPTVHIHLQIYTGLSSPTCEIPSLVTRPLGQASTGEDIPPGTGLASPEEAKSFELWLRRVWTEKEKRMEMFFKQGSFESDQGEKSREIIHVRQTRWYHWIAAFGGGGVGTVAAAAALGAGLRRDRERMANNM